MTLERPKLTKLNTQIKNKVLQALANNLILHSEKLTATNQMDMELAEKASLNSSLLKRLKLSKEKVHLMADQIRGVAKQIDPVDQVSHITQLDEDLVLVRRQVPLGVIAMIFESRPDAVTQIFSIAFKSGNAIILKGGSEARQSNRFLHDLIVMTLKEFNISSQWIRLIEERSEVAHLLEQVDAIDLIIPRGGSDLINYVQNNTKIPVLGHADGICHVYIDSEADWDKAIPVTVDSKTQYPAVCNAMETLLIHEEIAEPMLLMLSEKLNSVEIRGDDRAKKVLPEIKSACKGDWSTEYTDLILSVKIVSSLEEAIDHINRFGSHHTDCIVTEEESSARHFMESVDSASVLWNASTRFADGFRYGLGAEVGISTNKIHARGPVGIEGLLTYKYELTGQGQIVASYSGPSGKKFLHKKIKSPL